MELMAMTTQNQLQTQPKKADSAQLSRTSSTDQDSLSFHEKLNKNQLSDKNRRLGKLSPKKPVPQKSLVQNQGSYDGSAAHREIDPVQKKEQARSQQNGLTEAVDSLTRRAALQSFIRKMKQDLDVNPSEIVSAFMSLSSDQMKLPPEMNIEAIIGQLKLDPVAAQKASVYFDQMLADSSANSIADYLKGSSRQLSLEVMSRSEQRKALMESSLDSMNDKFFANPKIETVEAKNRQGSRDQAELGMKLVGLGVGAAGLSSAVNSFVQNSGTAATAASSTAQPSSSQATPALTEMPNQNPGLGHAQPQTQAFYASQAEAQGYMSEAGQLLNQLKGFEAPKAAIGAAGLAAYGASAAKPPAGSAVSGFAESLETTSFDISSNNDLLAGMSESTDSDGEGSSLDFSESGMASDQQMDDMGQEIDGADNIQFSVRTEPTKPGEKVSNVSSSFQVDAQPTEAENAKNVRDIVEQTQFLMKKGGGEAKVILNPEGMGQINLKVSTEGDQVSVDMVTESAEAKKLIEKGLGDLKATLASHKLNVENMKVDMAGEIAKQFDHAHDEAQRQSAQHFMENFRQENGSWRQGFFDVPGVRAPRNQGSEDGLTLESLQSQPKKSNRRLDLVA